MKTTVVGVGYVGLVCSAVFADMGHEVTGLDVDQGKIDSLNQGKVPIMEDGLEELLAKNRERIMFTTDAAAAYGDAQIIFIAVPTPERPDGSAELRYVFEAVDQIVASVTRDVIVVLKSTVPMGTNKKIQERLDALLQNTGHHAEVVSNPEFLSQGTAVKDMFHPDRIIVGATSKQARDIMAAFYRNASAPTLFMGLESAEMVKYASNDFLALKISYINEIANLCEMVGANIEDVAAGMGADHRIGNSFLKAGIGYGGSCFPKDTKALDWFSDFRGMELKTVKAAIEVNARQKLTLIRKAARYYADFEGLQVAVLGLAFKPGTDDLREAPSLQNISYLVDARANVRTWDPCAADNFKRHFPDLKVQLCDKIEDTLADADLCLIMTEWPEVRALKPEDFRIMRHRIVLDGRNCFDVKTMRDAGVTYESIGR